MRVLVAMSGGVDSSVAAALLIEQGHDVVGATMKLWSGPSDSGCCSVADVEDARRVAQQLGVDHHVFNFTAEFDERVVEPYVDAHARGRTPNPCVECNRHLKFDRFLRRARHLGFDAIATGHHARVITGADGTRELWRGVDGAKDQSYVLAVLGQDQLGRVLLPVGALPKSEVRAKAGALGLRTAGKPDSQDVCFISATGGRSAFLGDRIPLRPGRVVDGAGAVIGSVPAVELVTVGQRRGLGTGFGAGARRYAVEVDVGTATVIVGSEADLLRRRVTLETLSWVGRPAVSGTQVLAQVSAHGAARPATYDGVNALLWAEPQRRVAPGQVVALYDGDRVLGCGLAG